MLGSLQREDQGVQMSYWVCCNSCFLSAGADRKLGVTTCGHVVCSVCYQKGSQGKCLICNASCQVSPLSDKSSSEVKTLFSDIDAVATTHFTEIGKVMMFQERHQKRLLTHYQQRNEKLEEMLVRMKQEMQHVTKKLNEQSAYIATLETSLQHQSAKVSSAPQMSHSSHIGHGQKSVLQIPYNSPVTLSRHSSSTSMKKTPACLRSSPTHLSSLSSENMELDNRSLFRKPNTLPRLSLISPPQDGRMGTVSHRSSGQNTLTNHSTRSATVSRSHGSPLTPDISYSRSSAWSSPIFRPPSSFRHSMSSLVCPPP